MRNHYGSAVIGGLLASITVLVACADVRSPAEPLPVSTGDPSPSPIPTTTSVGDIIVNTATSGLFEGDGYSVRLDGTRKRIIRDDVTISFPSVSTGQHLLALTDLPGNCTVSGSNPQKVTVVDGATLRWIFDVTCSAPGGPSPE
ncbi:MAG: hypothetical protein ABFS14_06670 [Gemmatimonadota bacterium]